MKPEDRRSLTRWWHSAEDYHQQCLSDAENPGGYCGIGVIPV
jgi:peptide methionine sulfoxide reductase MsrA